MYIILLFLCCRIVRSYELGAFGMLDSEGVKSYRHPAAQKLAVVAGKVRGRRWIDVLAACAHTWRRFLPQLLTPSLPLSLFLLCCSPLVR